MAHVFTTPDGTPTAPANWTVQSSGNNNASSLGERATTRVFSSIDNTHTPVNVSGWTVQNAAIGSDQNTVQS